MTNFQFFYKYFKYFMIYVKCNAESSYSVNKNVILIEDKQNKW